MVACMGEAPSATVEDWSRERPRKFWDPSRKLLKSIRVYQKNRNDTSLWSLIICKLCVLEHRFWSVVTGAEIHLNAKISGGLMIPHPNGIVIHPDVEIGPNCLIFQQVTVGMVKGGIPQIGGHVDIGAGAKVLGGITIGDHACIGANAVVMDSVAEGQTVVGVPARPVEKSKHA